MGRQHERAIREHGTGVSLAFSRRLRLGGELGGLGAAESPLPSKSLSSNVFSLGMAWFPCWVACAPTTISTLQTQSAYRLLRECGRGAGGAKLQSRERAGAKREPCACHARAMRVPKLDPDPLAAGAQTRLPCRYRGLDTQMFRYTLHLIRLKTVELTIVNSYYWHW